MIEIILEEKHDLNFEKLKTMIEEKKTNVGAGYLTEQGALFLVAADLGVSLEKTQKIRIQSQRYIRRCKGCNYRRQNHDH